MSVVLLIRLAMRMRAFMSSVACLTVPDISILSHERQDLWGNVTEHKMCVLIFCVTMPETFPIIRRTDLEIITYLPTSSCKVLVTLAIF